MKDMNTVVCPPEPQTQTVEALKLQAMHKALDRVHDALKRHSEHFDTSDFTVRLTTPRIVHKDEFSGGTFECAAVVSIKTRLVC